MATDQERATERATTFLPPKLKREIEDSARVNRRSVASEILVRLERSSAPAPSPK